MHLEWEIFARIFYALLFLNGFLYLHILIQSLKHCAAAVAAEDDGDDSSAAIILTPQTSFDLFAVDLCFFPMRCQM